MITSREFGTVLALSLTLTLQAQNDMDETQAVPTEWVGDGVATPQDSLPLSPKEQKKAERARRKAEKQAKEDAVKTGWNFGALPFASYDNDLGLEIGALANIYYYGDGSIYPDYLHSLYVTASYKTSLSGVFRFSYDSRFLIPKHGFKFDLTYMPESMCDFYGFNGYQAKYQPDWLVNDASRPNHTRLFYKYKRNILRATLDIDGTIHQNWHWTAGIGLYWYDVSSVDLTFLNRPRQKKGNLYPEMDGLMEKYVDWGLIDKQETKGGVHPYARVGILYDSRDQTANPTKGIYADAFFTYNAAFGGRKNFNNLFFNFSFAQYITLWPKYLTFDYRIATQNLLVGKSPFYASSLYNVLHFVRDSYEALGGASSVRGILRNRILGKGFAFCNLELRAIFVRFDIGRQHFYVGGHPFFDLGIITQPYEIDRTQLQTAIQNANERNQTNDQLDDFFDFNTKTSSAYRPHMSAGFGLSAAMNENFVISVDWAAQLDKRDNNDYANFYIQIGYLF